MMSIAVDVRPNPRLATRRLDGGNTSCEQELFEGFCDFALCILRNAVEAGYDQRLRQRVDIDDIVQEAMLEVLARFEEFRRRSPMPILIWLRETALQQIKIAYRRHLIAQKRSIARQVSFEFLSMYHPAEQITAIGCTADQRFEETEQALRVQRECNGDTALFRVVRQPPF